MPLSSPPRAAIGRSSSARKAPASPAKKGSSPPGPRTDSKSFGTRKSAPVTACPPSPTANSTTSTARRKSATTTAKSASASSPAWTPRAGQPDSDAYEYLSIYKDQFGYNNGPRCSPLIDGDRVYTYGVEGEIHCVNADTGKPIWHVNANKDFNVITNFFGVGSTPVIEGNLLIAQVGGSPAGSNQRQLFSQTLKGNGCGVVAFDKLTGRVVYKLSDELASYSSPVLATINGRRWCFVFTRGGLLGFDPGNGKLDFHYPFRSDDVESVNASNPLVIGDKVFISETYGPGAALLESQARRLRSAPR